MSDEPRYDTVTAAETGTAENRGDVDRAAEIVAGLGDATPLRSVAAVIVGFVVLTLGSIVAGRLLGDPAGAAGPGAGGSTAPGSGAGSLPPLSTSFVLVNLGSRTVAAMLAGFLTARAAPRRPFLHGLALAALIALMSGASLLGLRAAGGLDENAWYPVVMSFLGPAGILLGALVGERLSRRRRTPTAAVGHAFIAIALAVGVAGCGGPGEDPGDEGDAVAGQAADASTVAAVEAEWWAACRRRMEGAG